MNLHLPLAPSTVFEMNIPGIGAVPITETVVTSWVVMTIIIIGAIVLRIIAMKSYAVNGEIPKGATNVAEYVVEGIYGFAKDNIHHHWRPFAPYIGALGLFLALSNVVGMFGFGIKPPTRDFNLPIALATVSIFLTLAAPIYYKGFVEFIKFYFRPVWWLFPLNILEVFARLVSLTARLFGNILAAYIIMEIIIQVAEIVFEKMFLGWGIPAVFSFYFDIFDGLLQAFVFTFLTTLYIEESLE